MALGFRGVRDMLATLSTADILDWMLFDQVEPLGPRESRAHLSILLAKVHNRWRRKEDPQLEAKDFLLQPPVASEDHHAQLREKQQAMIDTLRAMARPAAERPRYRKHPKELKRKAAAARGKKRK